MQAQEQALGELYVSLSRVLDKINSGNLRTPGEVSSELEALRRFISMPEIQAVDGLGNALDQLVGSAGTKSLEDNYSSINLFLTNLGEVIEQVASQQLPETTTVPVATSSVLPAGSPRGSPPLRSSPPLGGSPIRTQAPLFGSPVGTTTTTTTSPMTQQGYRFGTDTGTQPRPPTFTGIPGEFGSAVTEVTPVLSDNLLTQFSLDTIKSPGNVVQSLIAKLNSAPISSGTSQSAQQSKFKKIIDSSSLFDQENNDILFRLKSLPASSFTPDFRNKIIRWLQKSLTLSSPSEGRMVPNELASGFQEFTIKIEKTDEDKKESKRKKKPVSERPIKKILLITMTRPAVDSTNPETWLEQQTKREFFDNAAAEAYSKKNVAYQAKALALLIGLTHKYARAFGDKTHYKSGAALAISTIALDGTSTSRQGAIATISSHPRSLIMDETQGSSNSFVGFYMTLDDHKDICNTVAILANNMSYTGTLGRKAIIDPLSFQRAVNRVVFPLKFVADWLKNEQFGIVTPDSSVNGCYTSWDATTTGDTTTYQFVCSFRNVLDRIGEIAAELYESYSGSPRSEYYGVITNLSETKLLASTIAKERTIKNLIYLARIFGRVDGTQNVDLNGSEGKKPTIGSQLEKDKTDKSKGPSAFYKATDAMKTYLSEPINAVIQEDANVSMDKISQLAFNKIYKNLINDPKNQEVVKASSYISSPVLTQKEREDSKKESGLPDDYIYANNVPYRALRYALHAEAEAIRQYKVRIETAVKKAKGAYDSRKSASDKASKTSS